MGVIAATERGTTEPVAPAPASGRDRVAEAALALIADRGTRGLTVEVIAAEAGVSRASVYRWFPGGRTDVLLAAGSLEVARFFAELEPRLAAARTLDDVLAEGLACAVRFLRDSRPLQALLANEPELVLPHLAFDRMDTAFAVAAEVAVVHLRPFLSEPDAHRAAELVARLALSHTLSPPADVDVGDLDAARRLVQRFVTPGLVTPSDPTPQTTRS